MRYRYGPYEEPQGGREGTPAFFQTADEKMIVAGIG